MRKVLITLFVCLQLILTQACLDSFQDHDVNPVEQPYYALEGTVIDEAYDAFVSQAMISITMTYAHTGEWYEGGWTQSKQMRSDSLGHYRFDSLYLGQYLLKVWQDDELSYSNQIDFFQYADRVYDIIIPDPDMMLSGQISSCTSSGLLSEVSVFLTPVELWDGAVMNPRETRTETSGQFVFKDIYPGDYLLQAFRRDLYARSEYIRVLDDSTKHMIYDFCMGFYKFD
ncbi:MAG: hypothetical protein K9M49_09300 [Candidatus Marinimicrobia bacterium]|nr:hypothetical protein [Candidatus Neomarinimicrobiota bacterium]MCF7851243.1 hypothetical protein [Candidatus Neomarinimicrobiota bacterium]MCF7905331.1 hypothetical protein [Candidatus Neomarinimicrobiota bacterium]